MTVLELRNKLNDLLTETNIDYSNHLVVFYDKYDNHVFKVSEVDELPFNTDFKFSLENPSTLYYKWPLNSKHHNLQLYDLIATEDYDDSSGLNIIELTGGFD